MLQTAEAAGAKADGWAVTLPSEERLQLAILRISELNKASRGWTLNEVSEPMKSLFERLRSHRLASTFVLLATLSAALVGGSFAAHGVRGQEKQNESSDATPLKVDNSSAAPNEFVKIAKAVGPAVVNINTQTLPKNLGQQGTPDAESSQPPQPNPQNPDGDDDDQDQASGQLDRGQGPENNFQDFFNKFFGGQVPDQDGEDEARFANLSAPASSSIPRATSSPTIT